MDDDAFAIRVEGNAILAGILRTLQRQLAEAHAENARLQAALDDDAMAAIVHGALADLGVRTRLDTGESMREYCNSVAREIIGALRRQYAAAREGDEGWKCDCGRDGQACEQCGQVFCMHCFRRYSWQATSRLCSTCQYEADMEWMNEVCRGKKNAVMRKWPRGGTP